MMTSILLITCSKGKKKKGKDAAIENLKGKKVKSKEAIPPKSEKNSQLGNLNKKVKFKLNVEELVVLFNFFRKKRREEKDETNQNLIRTQNKHKRWVEAMKR